MNWQYPSWFVPMPVGANRPQQRGVRFPRNFAFQEVRYNLNQLEGSEMRKIPKQEFTAEFKEQAVRQLRAGKTTGELAAELGVSDQTLRNWR